MAADHKELIIKMVERISKSIINSIIEVWYLQVTAPKNGYLITEEIGNWVRREKARGRRMRKSKGHWESLVLGGGGIGSAFKRELLSFSS